jgi:hypothetical protein
MKRIKINWESIGIWTYLISFWGVVIILAGLVLTGCSAPKVIEQHHHHYEQADTLAIQAQVDKQLNSWHAQMDSSWRQSWQEYSASLFSNEDEKEKVTETITTWTDSLGREMRQEQRTTDRSLSRLQQQTEQRLASEFEHRIRIALDSVNALWQHRLDALQAHWEQTDTLSTSVQSGGTFAADSLPWHKRWWRSMKDYLLLAAILFILLSTARLWLPLLLNLFSKK